MRVLIIEDEPGAAIVLKEYFEAVSDDVITAPSVDDALALAVIDGYKIADIVTLDLRLPGSNADETLDRIADIKKANPGCLVVIISGMRYHNIEKSAADHGADAFIEKCRAISMQNGKTGFLQILRDLVKSLKGTPQRYQQSSLLLEKLSGRLEAHFKQIK